MHNQIAFLQVREINVQRRARGQGVRGFRRRGRWILYRPKISASVTTTNFASSQKKSAGERAEMNGRRCAESMRAECALAFRPSAAKLGPDFLEPLPFAVVVAKNVDGIILPQPAMKLLKEFAALRLGDLRFRRAFGQRAEGFEGGELGADCDPGFPD